MPSPEPLDDRERALLAGIARRSLEDAFAGRATELDVDALPEGLRRPGACFVTLERGGELRGCIGSIEARRPLADDVVENARAAAFEDYRFAPLERRELATLDIHLSVLGESEPFPVADEADLLARLVPGEDGLILEEGFHRATFLPQVWESLPDPRDFVRQLKRKAGLAPDHWSRSLSFRRYRVESIP
jgi:AmmeMemoRadiSam system protein A